MLSRITTSGLTGRRKTFLLLCASFNAGIASLWIPFVVRFCESCVVLIFSRKQTCYTDSKSKWDIQAYKCNGVLIYTTIYIQNSRIAVSRNKSGHARENRWNIASNDDAFFNFVLCFRALYNTKTYRTIHILIVRYVDNGPSIATTS